jgi:hypothetical protein
MSSKPVLMIHHIDETMFDLPLENYTLTFDDGTTDHYEYLHRFRDIPTEKIYFITTGFVGKKGYISKEQLEEMGNEPLTTIGGHGHYHTDMRGNKDLKDVLTTINKEARTMIEWFATNNIRLPVDFCFPFNYNPHGLYSAVLKNKGFINFYGGERIPVETLLRT